jgi:hypothetical protein
LHQLSVQQITLQHRCTRTCPDTVSDSLTSALLCDAGESLSAAIQADTDSESDSDSEDDEVDEEVLKVSERILDYMQTSDDPAADLMGTDADITLHGAAGLSAEHPVQQEAEKKQLSLKQGAAVSASSERHAAATPPHVQAWQRPQTPDISASAAVQEMVYGPVSTSAPAQDDEEGRCVCQRHEWLAHPA